MLTALVNGQNQDSIIHMYTFKKLTHNPLRVQNSRSGRGGVGKLVELSKRRPANHNNATGTSGSDGGV